MNLVYEGKDITNYVDIKKADIYDNAGGIADNVDISFSDTQGLWSKWNPQKGQTIELKKSGFSSGTMFIDQIEQTSGIFRIKGTALPLDSRTQNNKGWEKVRFSKILKEIADKYGFELETYGFTDFLYERVDQIEQTDFEFLSYRAMLEGDVLKISNKKIIVYDEAYQEQQQTVKNIYKSDMDGDYLFKTVSIGLFSSCIVTSGDITYNFKPSMAPVGPMLKRNLYLSNYAEAERFSKGLLRASNRNEYIGSFQKQLDTGLAAGCNVNIYDIGIFDGKYFINQIIHRLVEEKSIIKLRKPLEGY